MAVVVSFPFHSRDDTLLASTVLCTSGITLQSTKMSKDLKMQFQQLETQVIRLLAKAIESACRIFIITNAECGWVELSAAKFMPRGQRHCPFGLLLG